jgi:hypothetical protein
MTNKTVTMSREMAERLIKGNASEGATALQLFDAWKAMDELRALLAAPVVERQEPVAWVNPYALTSFSENEKQWVRTPVSLAENRANGYTHPLYTSPPAPVVVEERAEFVAWVRREWPQAPLSNVRDLLPKNDPRYGEYCDETLQRAWVGWQARASLDNVKTLNPL